MLRPCGVLAVHPPGEVQHQLVEDALQEVAVALPAPALLVDLVDPPGGPGMDGRVHVAELPLVGRHLAVRVHVPFARQQDELRLGELGIDQGERHAVEGQIPGRVPGVLPLVRHRDHVGIVQVPPVAVAAVLAPLRRRGLGRVALQPLADVVVEELLAPDHAGQGLALDGAGILAGDVLLQLGIELVRLGTAPTHHLVEVGETRRRRGPRHSGAGAGGPRPAAARPAGSGRRPWCRCGRGSRHRRHRPRHGR